MCVCVCVFVCVSVCLSVAVLAPTYLVCMFEVRSHRVPLALYIATAHLKSYLNLGACAKVTVVVLCVCVCV